VLVGVGRADVVVFVGGGSVVVVVVDS